MKWNLIYIVTGFLMVFILIIIADYLQLFGISQVSEFDIINLNFKPVDEDTGAPVTDVHIRCFQKSNNNACSEKESPGYGLVTVAVPVTRIINRSMFFEHDSRIEETADPKLHIMFIHNDYNNPVETLNVNEIPSKEGSIRKIIMPRAVLR